MDDETKQALNNITAVMQQRFTQLIELMDQRFKALEACMNEGFEAVENSVVVLKKDMQEGFALLDQKIEGISVKVEFLEDIRDRVAQEGQK